MEGLACNRDVLLPRPEVEIHLCYCLNVVLCNNKTIIEMIFDYRINHSVGNKLSGPEQKYLQPIS